MEKCTSNMMQPKCRSDAIFSAIALELFEVLDICVKTFHTPLPFFYHGKVSDWERHLISQPFSKIWSLENYSLVYHPSTVEIREFSKLLLSFHGTKFPRRFFLPKLSHGNLNLFFCMLVRKKNQICSY